MLKLRTPEDIEKLPGYLPSVDPQVTPLSRIVDYYYIRPFEIRCALCGQSHMEGCIVELANSRVSNIGHVCGKRFGDRYDEERRRYSQSTRKPELIKKICAAQDKLSPLNFEIAELRHRADALARRRTNFGVAFPDLIQLLQRRAQNNEERVYQSIERTKDELENAIAANPFRPREELRFRQELRGSIRGYRFLGIDWSPESGARKVFSELDRFSALQPRSLSMQELTRWANWSEDYGNLLATVEAGVREGDAFFCQENFPMFQHLTSFQEVREKLRDFDLRALDRKSSQPTLEPVKVVSGRVKKPQPQGISNKELRRLTSNKKMRF